MIFGLVASPLPSSRAHAQSDPVSLILAIKKAKLIVIGETGSLMRAYSRPTPGDSGAGGDFSEILFRVVTVLKGDYKAKEIGVYYAAHMGLEEKSKWVLIVDDNTELLDSADKRVLTPLLKRSPDRYASNSTWLIEATREEVAAVKQWIDCQAQRR